MTEYPEWFTKWCQEMGFVSYGEPQMDWDDPKWTANLTGAQFQRVVGADPEKWAAALIAAYAATDHVCSDADRLAFVTSWIRDAMDAALRAHKEPEVQ